ncbi:hypothetical protein AUJ65_02585 [Candidatus Micrarchaeota archaeon CG1_02_51_15]|nr:MAG: hypothetical protein AUJ65_02585 [Candidatus Micrarchaeota archaeon CG1_02_51_15]
MKHCALIGAAAVLAMLAVWSPFLLDDNADAISRYWDGPSYVTVAYSLYAADNAVYSAYSLKPVFYAAHFPAYPLAIRALSFMGYFNAMLLATAFFTVLACTAFYFLAREYAQPDAAFLLSLLFTVFPARWLLYHSVGATEPLFIFAAIASVYFLRKKSFGACAAFAVLATLTRVNGVLLFPAFIVALWLQDRRSLNAKTLAWLSLIPVSFACLLCFHWLQFGDFFAAFQVNAGYAQGFLSSITAYGGAQAGELTVLLFAAYAAGVARLWQRKRFELCLVAIVFIFPILFLAHNDASRYLLPAAPFALLLAFDDVLAPLLKRKSFWLAVALYVAAALVYCWNVLPQNLMPLNAFQKLLTIITR